MPSKPFPKSVAAIVGIDRYGSGIPKLRNACRDARELARVLEKDHGYQVHLLVEDVTREKLENLFRKRLKKEIEDGDRLLVYFAGHGLARDDETGLSGYLVPQDARAEPGGGFGSLLSMDLLKRYLGELPCHHLLLILDCCFAGAFRWSLTRDSDFFFEEVHEELYQRFNDDPARQVITSAAHDQKAYDELWGVGQRGTEEGHSPFAAALFEGLAGEADLVPKQGNGLITAHELHLYLRERVEPLIETRQGRQTPGLFSLLEHDKGEFFFESPKKDLDLPPAPDLTEKANPFRGLEPFEAEHQDLFFGREAILARLTQTLRKQPLTVVAGPSGTGKSSLVRAGLLPPLSEDPNWCVVGPIRSGKHPVAALLEVLRKQGIVATPGLAAVEGELRDWLEAHPDQRLLIAIDQFEELITTVVDEREQEAFQELVAEILEAHPDRLRILVTVRTDFEPLFAEGPLAALWLDSRLVIPQMTHDELRQAILGPAARCVLFFEEGLVEELVEEVLQEPGALPLLSFTLRQLYQAYIDSERTDRRLTRADYDALGGVIGSLNRRANGELAALPDDSHRDTLKRVMLRMVTLQGGEPTRRRVTRRELEYSEEAENDRVQEVLERLSAQRLIIADRDPGPGGSGGAAAVEPAHDKLINAWDTLRDWLKEAGEELPLQLRVSQACDDWLAHDRDKNLLWWDDPRLPQLRHAGLLKPWLNRWEVEFARDSRRSLLLRRTALWGSIAAVLIATILAAFVFYQQNQANLRQRFSLMTQRLAEQVPAALEEQNPQRNPHRALLLARQAYNIHPQGGDGHLARVDKALRLALDASPSSELLHRDDDFELTTFVFHPTRPLVAAGAGARIWLIDTSVDGEQPTALEPEAGGIETLVWSDDGRLLAAGTATGQLCVWRFLGSSSDPDAACETLDVEGDGVQGLAFQPGSSTLVSAHGTADGGQLRIWELDSDLETLRPRDRASVDLDLSLTSIAVDAAGQIFAVSPESTTLFRFQIDNPDATPATLEADLADVDRVIHSLTFSPNGWLLTGVTNFGELLLWNASTMTGPLPVLDESITQLVFLPEGDHMITADLGSRLSWRETESFSAQATLESFCPGSTLGLAISSDGRTLAASCDREARVWRDVELKTTKDSPSRLVLAEPAASQLVFDASDRLVVGRVDGSLALWDLDDRNFETVERTGCQPLGIDWAQRFLEGIGTQASDQVTALLWNAGRWTVFAQDGEYWSYDPGSSSPPDCEPANLGGRTCRAALSADGQWLATIVSSESLGPLMSVQRLGEDDEGVPLTGATSVTVEICTGGLAFHPRQNRVVGGIGNLLRSWSLETTADGQSNWESRELATLPDAIYSVAFSLNGQQLAVGGGLRGTSGFVWSRRSSDEETSILSVAEASIHGVELSRDGKQLAAVGSDGAIRLWTLSALQTPPIILSEPGIAFSDISFSPDGNRLASSIDSNQVWIWNLDTDKLATRACLTSASNLTWEDWNRFVGSDEPYERTCSGLPVHPSVVQAGDRQVQDGDEASGLELFRHVATIQPDLGLDPRRRLQALQLREQVLAGSQPDLEKLLPALDAMHDLEHLVLNVAIAPLPYASSLQLCRWTALLGEPRKALPACQRALELFPEDDMILDSRGIARALTGDLAGAADDFEHTWDALHDETWRTQRRRWVERLRNGENPLTPEVIRVIVKEDLGQ